MRRIERRTAPPAEADSRAAYDALGAVAAAERATHCSVPKEGGWRPGARWARSDRAEVEAAIEALPAHRRPPQRELGRVSQAADNPFRRPAEERVAPPSVLRELSRRTEAAEPLFRPGTRGWDGKDLQSSIHALPAHQRPSFQELSRRSEVIDHPFRPIPADEVGRHAARIPLQFPGEDAPAKHVLSNAAGGVEGAGRGAALRGDAGRECLGNEALPSRNVAPAAAHQHRPLADEPASSPSGAPHAHPSPAKAGAQVGNRREASSPLPPGPSPLVPDLRGGSAPTGTDQGATCDTMPAGELPTGTPNNPQHAHNRNPSSRRSSGSPNAHPSPAKAGAQVGNRRDASCPLPPTPSQPAPDLRGEGTAANGTTPAVEADRLARSPRSPSPAEPARPDPRRDRYRNEAPPAPLSIQRTAALPLNMPSVQFPGEDMPTRRAQRALRRSARDGHGGEAGYIAAPSLAQLAAMPAVQFPGEGPHPDNHGKSEPAAPTYGQGRFFQTGRTLGSVVARVCRDEDAPAALAFSAPAEPPLVTTHKVGARVEIAAVNPAAQALGLARGIALTLARAQVPDLEVRAADPQGDAAELRALAELLARRWAPTVAISDADGLLIDLTGVAHLHGGEARFARRLLRLLARHGVTGRLAIADSAGAAWALARHGRATVEIVQPGAHAAALAPLPVAALRLEPPDLELLARLGVDSAGQLLDMPRAPLVRRFGAAIVTRLDQATGRAPEPLDPVLPPTRIEVEQRFAEPLLTAEPIAHWLAALMTRLVEELARAGLGARAVELVAARIDNRPQRLRLGFARPTRDAAHMLRLALRRIEEIDPGCGIETLALLVHRADPLGATSLAPSLAGEAAPDLAPLIDALVNRIGSGRLWRVQPVESDVPERALAFLAPLDPPAGRSFALRRDDVRRLDARAPDHPWHPRWPRPALLLRRPEPVEHVLAELPDQPPRRFTWRGSSHRVVRADGPERIAGEWWRRPAERLAVRDYYRVEVEAGDRFWLYRRGDGLRAETGDLAWFLHGR